jgi:hypothetical protein
MRDIAKVDLPKSSFQELQCAGVCGCGARQGRVPSLLEPLPVGVEGSPAQMGVMTGAATPMSSVTLGFVPL